MSRPSDGLAALTRLVAQDAALAARLRAIEDPAALVRAAVAAGAAHGLAVAADALERRMDDNRAGFVRPVAPPDPVGDGGPPPVAGGGGAPRLDGWTPFGAGWIDGAMTVEWCHLGEHRFTDPFFYETIARAIGTPFNRAFRPRLPADALAALAPGVRPSGFVFHMARCGSTLAAQALSADPRHVVASEPGPVRAMLEAPRHADLAPERADAWLAGIVSALARPRAPGEDRFFVKFMAADILELPRIQRVFPDVPWLFLYRDPVEILASQMRRGGADTGRGTIPPDRLGLTRDAVLAMDRREYQLAAMAAYGRAALDGLARAPGRGRVLRYDDLPDGLWRLFATHFGLDPALPGFAAMRAASLRHAKTGAAFTPDGPAKREAAAAWRPAAERIVGPVLAALDAVRERPAV
ncbi:sulfotransferase family protein [Methylobacterium platani]|uniref:Aspartyl beta-hydroxylase n=2 Tax=Methylobacterium platani TaxID=427683 RepID=A0A179SIT1_9HYPH|nr:sulfotransferase family protein [Methylobacterium platani]KMO15111.1 hypothetical protein SQ03_17810 [Methylobacterium platani JCM 14648]OAS26910.1 hypothetical protein A5481_02770 [Methylobacterium platani]